MMKKQIASLLLSTIVASAAAPVGNWYVDHFNVNADFNKSLFYSNENIVKGADPSTIWVDESEITNELYEEDDGYFYTYVTGSSTINAFRSKNLTDWQDLGAVFRPDLDVSWAYYNYWAPSVHYDATFEGGKYILFYTACYKKYVDEGARYYISLATADSPAGPFVEYTDENKTAGEPLVDFANISKDSPLYEEYVTGGYADGYMCAIDAETFVDPETGKKYLLFCHDRAGAYTSSTVYIMEMEDWNKPCYDKIYPLTENSKTTYGGSEYIEDKNVNEGCFMYYHNGMYYLTYSVYTYNMSQYQVRQAVSDSPTGPFRKIAYDDGGVVLTTDGLGVYTNSSGHASIIDIGGEPYISYHAFLNDEDLSQGRKLRVDKLSFVTNSEGQEILYANGPTVTAQALPEAVSGYKNIASEAYVSAKGVKGANPYWLTDGTIKAHTFSPVEEFVFGKNKRKITLTFDDYKTVRAVMVHNSREFARSFDSVKITLTYLKDGKEVQCKTDGLQFNYDKYAQVNYKLIYVGAAVTAEFAEMQVKKITIEIEGKNSEVAVSDIVVLGKGGDA